ncbi:biliverdin-producing heme oxygenase [Bradyrhizobium sp.]|uniref:biliverdin-producing heme oxygenase n=1 Tax=Bradyrhizobium sp. TaxID=376 RepID=UPI000A40C548|nr:biliverdin-producing heme oxygenase [Bradyrhizobium sp.]
MTVASADNSLPVSVVTALYLRTKALHVEAERTGIIRDLLRGEASREGYVLLLRNLLPAYQAMEQGLERHRGSEGLAALAGFRFDRAPAIEADLAGLCGHRWERDIPLLSAGDIYARRIAKAAEGDGIRLIAHAYTRYLGDLSGGQILQRLLTRSLKLKPTELTFYDFPRFYDLEALKADFRQALDAAGALASDPQAVVEEGAIAFSLNIDLSCAVQALLSSRTITATAAE